VVAVQAPDGYDQQCDKKGDSRWQRSSLHTANIVPYRRISRLLRRFFELVCSIFVEGPDKVSDLGKSEPDCPRAQQPIPYWVQPRQTQTSRRRVALGKSTPPFHAQFPQCLQMLLEVRKCQTQRSASKIG
jgi:hypothetical protein